jgi:hypothetical protein
MSKRIRIIASLFSMLAAGSASAAVDCTGVAGEVLVNGATNPETGHYFEVYAANGIDWVSANRSASARTCGGVAGHLATVTSSGEEAFVDQFRHDSLGSGLPQPQVWVGGYQDGGWRWVNNEGPFPSVNTEPAYANWAPGEPNNSGGVENHLTLGRFDSGGPWVDGGWNDEGVAPGSIGGYIVEYDVPRPAACTGASCETINGQFLTFPPGSFQPGDTIKFNAYEFADPRVAAGQCGVNGLTLFSDPNDGKPELRIPAYLCGSPKFVVVAVDSSELDILDGTVFVENQTNVVLPNNLYQCHDPIVRNFPTQGDPQFEDVVVWQTTDPTRMLENTRGVGQFAGAAGEFTSSCGSSQAKIKGASYYVVGLHIDFGPGYLWSANTAGNNERFTALTRYKLTLLQQAVADSLSAGALKNGDATKMSSQLTNAVKNLDRGDPDDALENVNKFLKFVAAAKYTIVPGQNYNGEHVMRGTNIQFMLRVKVIPYTPHH